MENCPLALYIYEIDQTWRKGMSSVVEYPLVLRNKKKNMNV